MYPIIIYRFNFTYIPQLLAEYIQYQYINSTNMYSPIVGRIYPIPTDMLSQINIYLYWINTIYRIQIILGPNLPGPDLPGPKLPQQNFQGPNLPPRGPICRGPICLEPAGSPFIQPIVFSKVLLVQKTGPYSDAGYASLSRTPVKARCYKSGSGSFSVLVLIKFSQVKV